MKYCTKCLMPDTRPGSIFDEKGVCGACRSYEKRKDVNWKSRMAELKKLCDEHRRDDGYYDCIVPVSGGKDSHTQVKIIKEDMNMNPLLITVGDPFSRTKAGRHNFENLGKVFNCDHILFSLSPAMLKKAMRIGFEESANPIEFVEAACYTVVQKLAVNMNIPLVFFGENPEYQYGTTEEDKWLANEYIDKGLDWGIFKTIDVKYWSKKGIPKKELNAFIPPTKEEYTRVKPKIVFMSYFMPWSATENLEVAKKYGFRDLAHEWKRAGFIEDFEQVDSVAYMVHFWLKYPKFGFQRTSDIASRRVREGKLSKEDAKKLIMDNDHMLDRRALDDFIQFAGYSHKEFWDVVEKFWNKDLFHKVDGEWKLKNPVYKDLLLK